MFSSLLQFLTYLHNNFLCIPLHIDLKYPKPPLKWLDNQTPENQNKIIKKCTYSKSNLSDIYQEENKK